MSVAEPGMSKKRGRTARRLVVVAVLGALVVIGAVVAGPASAGTVDVPIGETIIGGAPGSSVQIGTSAVPDDLVGRTCTVVAEITNAESVHPGNTLVVTSGDSAVQISAIEDVAGGVVREGGSLTLGASIDASIVFGPDGVSSLGSTLTLTCEALPPAPPAPPIQADPPYTG